MIAALHRVREGYVGVYFKNGALLEDISQPGIHWMQPFVTEVVYIRVTPETMKLSPMICTTQDGVKNVFRDVQVIIFFVNKQLNEKEHNFSNYFFRSSHPLTRNKFTNWLKDLHPN